ncbi:MAG: SCP2 sterol-binding domain-containing protein [Bacteroidetes bacterium]|nr:SCP2 sterol-binding domain-containing protein [Bacteroidota bacterium]
MTLEELTAKIQNLVQEHGGKIKATVKFVFEDGSVIYLNDTVSPAQVNNENESAQCTVKMSSENFVKLLDGDMNSMGAYMMGKMKIDGDMTIAMKLANMF